MTVLFFVIFGLIIGLLARALMPGRQSMGLLSTLLIGVAGSFFGGFLGSLIAGEEIGLHPAGFIGSLLGALLLLALIGLGRRKARV